MRKLLPSLISIIILIPSTTAVNNRFCQETTTDFEICGHRRTVTRITSLGGTELILDVRNFSRIGPTAFRTLFLRELHFIHPNPHDCVPKTMGMSPLSADDFWVQNLLKLQCIKLAVKSRIFKNCEAVSSLSLENVELIGNSSEFFKDFRQLKTLELYNTNMTTISADIFAGVTNKLSELLMRGIRIIENKAFKKFSNLRILAIRTGELSDIQENWFVGIRNLVQLDLKENNITVLQNLRFKRLRNLKELYLDHNRINQIEIKAFFGLGNLRKLHLGYNNINYLCPQVFRKLGQLEILNIAHNKITRLQTNTFYGLHILAVLNLDYNEISQIDEKSFHSAVLMKLDLKNNNLTVLEPKMFTGLSKVDKLDVRFNNIVEIHPHTFERLNFEQVLFCDLNVTELRVEGMTYGKVIKNDDCSTQYEENDNTFNPEYLYV